MRLRFYIYFRGRNPLVILQKTRPIFVLLSHHQDAEDIEIMK
jgi:hypothetical protein